MKGEKSVARATVAVWRIQAALAALIVMGAGGTVVLSIMEQPWGPIATAFWLAGLVVLLGLAWWLPGLAYRCLGYRLDGHGLVIRKGLFWRHRIAIPRVRIQHSDVSQGPLQRRYGVATLKLYTAGSRFTCNELPGLDHDTALALRDTLLRQDDGGDGDAV